jgi:hypothetical protein
LHTKQLWLMRLLPDEQFLSIRWLSIPVLALLMPIVGAVAVTEPPVKKSKSGICHDALSASYSATKHFKTYQSTEDCLKSGGRLPKTPIPSRRDESSGETLVAIQSVKEDTMASTLTQPKVLGGGLAAGSALAGYLVWRRRRRGSVNSREDLDRRRWEGHRLESKSSNWESSVPEPSDAEIFKRRRHRWDPWLKRIGYFDNKKK